MKYDDALKIYNEEYASPISHIIPEAFFVNITTSGDYVLTDQGGYLLEKRKWEVLKTLFDHFYSNVTETEILEANNTIDKWRGNESKELKRPKKASEGYVYFLLADNGLVKIGRTKNLQERLDHFTTKLPYELTLIHSIKTNNSVETEKYYHEKFKDKRIRGEWFELSVDDLISLRSEVDE